MSKENSFFNKGLFTSITTLMSGSVLAQLITVLASPIMTRMYTEEQIGEYTLILTAISMFGTVICGRYDQTIVSETDESKAFALVRLCLLITAAASPVVGIGYTLYYNCSGSLSLSVWETFFWIGFLLLLTGIGNILNAYNNRCKQYKIMAATHVARSVGKEAALIGFGALKAGSFGLLFSHMLGLGLGLNSQSKSLRKNKDKLKKITIKEIFGVARRHKRQPLFSVPASFANSYSYSVLNIFVSNLFGNSVLAHYSMSFRILGLPLTLISTNVSRAFFEKAAREYDEKGNFKKTFLQTSLLLMAVAIPMVVLLMLLAPWAFEVFFGSGWGQAGVYVQYLAPMFGLRLIVSALSPTMTICNKQNIDLYMQVLFVGVVYAVYYLCNTDTSMELFLMGVSLGFSLCYVVYYLGMLKMSYSQKEGENSDD